MSGNCGKRGAAHRVSESKGITNLRFGEKGRFPQNSTETKRLVRKIVIAKVCIRSRLHVN